MQLSVEMREQFGRAVKELRRKGFIPAELYGRGIPNVHLAVSAKEFAKIFKEAGEHTVLQLAVGGTERQALIHEVARDYLTGEASHIDFYEVRMDEKIRAKIPLEFTGIAPGVRDKGGILNKAMADIEVEALPADLPRRLIVDIGTLDDINKSLYVRDVSVPAGVKILVDSATAIVTVTPPLAEEIKEAAAPDLSAVKVETEEKKEERTKEREGKEAGAAGKVSPPASGTKSK